MKAKVIPFPKQQESVAYLTGETLLLAEELQGVRIFDSDGNRVLPGELYEVTPEGARRVA